MDGVKGEGGTGEEKNHRSEEGDLVPDRRGMGEVGGIENGDRGGVKTATPWGRIRGEIPRREWDKAESGKKIRRDRESFGKRQLARDV